MKILLLTYVNRSGSTFLANLLSSSGHICTCPEGDALVRLFLEDPGKTFDKSMLFPGSLKEYLDRDWKMGVWDIREDIETYLANARYNWDAFRAFLSYYAEKNKPGASMILFKAERLSALMDRIALADRGRHGGDLKFISLVRDPRAVIASQLNTKMPGSTGTMTKNAVWAAVRWSKHISQISIDERNITIRKIVVFEDLIRQMDSNIKEISDFLGLELTGISPQGGELLGRLPEDVRHIHPLAGLSPQEERIDHWKNVLDPRKTYMIERTCAPYLQKFGYERSTNTDKPLLEVIRRIQVGLFTLRSIALSIGFHFNLQKYHAAL